MEHSILRCIRKIQKKATAHTIKETAVHVVDGHNHFLKGVMADISESEGENTAAATDGTVKEAQQNSLDASQQSSLTKLLSKDLTKFLKLHKKSLEGYGMGTPNDRP